MEAEFWHARWREGRTNWDQAIPHRFLHQHWSRAGVPPGGTVFVPLCGKSVDMVWLASHGHRVIGSELSEEGISEFLAARDEPVSRRTEGTFTVSSAGRFELWGGDVFELPTTALADVDAVFDRAALVALPPDTRRRYADHIANIIPPSAPIFLITFEYDQAQMAGPPFSVIRDEVADLFAGYDVDVLAVEDAMGPNSDLGQRGLTALAETVMILQRS